MLNIPGAEDLKLKSANMYFDLANLPNYCTGNQYLY